MRIPARGTLLLASLAIGSSAAWSQADCSGTRTYKTPLDELGAGTYQGYEGGLYPASSNTRPASHERALDRTSRMILLDGAGHPDAVNGIFVLIAIGMSNANVEFSSFMGDAAADPQVNSHVVLVNCAELSATSDVIVDPEAPYWGFVGDTLTAAGVTPLQVQSVWLKEGRAFPTEPWPESATIFRDDLRAIVQILKSSFPNLRSVYHTSRIYAGYGPDGISPEPYAYEYGFSVKWLIEEQLDGSPDLNFDPARGAVLAPWMSWGPYLWADGIEPRSDGLAWLCEDFSSDDGIHPSPLGRRKVGERLLSFFETDATTAPWFLDCDLAAAGTFASPPEVLGDAMRRIAPGQIELGWNSLDPVVGSDVVYDVVTGRLSELRADAGFARASCLVSGLADTPYVDSLAGPPPGNGAYYLVRGRNSCGIGTFGDGSANPDPRDSLDAGAPACPP
jgi:hypothetical protein